MLSLCFWKKFCWCNGFIIGLSQISSFHSSYYFKCTFIQKIFSSSISEHTLQDPNSVPVWSISDMYAMAVYALSHGRWDISWSRYSVISRGMSYDMYRPLAKLKASLISPALSTFDMICNEMIGYLKSFICSSIYLFVYSILNLLEHFFAWTIGHQRWTSFKQLRYSPLLKHQYTVVGSWSLKQPHFRSFTCKD